LWEQPIPKVWWKVIGYTGQDAEEMGFEVVHGILAALHWWHPVGTSSMSNLHVSQMCFFMFSDTSLSRTFFFGTMLAHFSESRSALCARIILASLRFFMGSTRMALLSISIVTMMYLLPLQDLVGNWPVWLENMALRTMYIWVYTLRTCLRAMYVWV
jgi:hypothetical protein